MQFLEVNMNRKKTKDEWQTKAVFCLLVFAVSMLFTLPAAWWYESRGFNELEQQHATCFAKRYILEQYFNVSNKQAKQPKPGTCPYDYLSLKSAPGVEEVKAVGNLTRATERVFIFPWPEIGIALAGIAIFQLVSLVDGKRRSRNA